MLFSPPRFALLPSPLHNHERSSAVYGGDVDAVHGGPVARAGAPGPHLQVPQGGALRSPRPPSPHSQEPPIHGTPISWVIGNSDLFCVFCLFFMWSLSLYGFFAVGGYYGKKIDPEPGRCRRTDGKKWRCSRDAHPDSKYCDRHMIRRRYRSRKPVESQPHSSSASSNSVAASASAASSATGSAASSATASAAASATTLNTLPLHTNGAREGFTFTLGNSATTANPTLPHLHMDPLTLSGDNTKKTYRYVCPLASFRLSPLWVFFNWLFFILFNYVWMASEGELCVTSSGETRLLLML